MTIMVIMIVIGFIRETSMILTLYLLISAVVFLVLGFFWRMDCTLDVISKVMALALAVAGFILVALRLNGQL